MNALSPRHPWKIFHSAHRDMHGRQESSEQNAKTLYVPLNRFPKTSSLFASVAPETYTSCYDFSLDSSEHTNQPSERCSRPVLGVRRTSTQRTLASASSKPRLEKEREMNLPTTDMIVQSMVRVNLRFEDVTKAGCTDKFPISSGIVRSIAGIHQTFEDVMRRSRIIERVSSDVADLTLKVQVQQVAFANACRLLFITAAMNQQDVDSMIVDRYHPIWKDVSAHQNLDKVIARFYHVYSITLNHFQESLKHLKAGLQAMKGQGKIRGFRRYSLRLKMLKSMNFGATEDFSALVQGVKNYNDIFCTLVWQAVPRRSDCILGSSFAEELGYQHNTGKASASHCHLEHMQRVTQVLHDTLSDAWSSCTYGAHSLSISLDFDLAEAGATIGSKDFHFSIAVTSPCCDSTYRLVMDLPHGDYSTSQTVEKDRCSKKACMAYKSAEAAKRTITLNSSAYRVERQMPAVTVYTSSMQNGVLDLDFAEDLCHQLRSSPIFVDPERGTDNSALGYLEASKGFRFFVSSASRYERQSSHSLDEILLRAHNEGRAIPLEDRLRTAWLLARAILYLNTSSWLSQAWSTRDVHFFDRDENKSWALGEPFLQAPLEDKTNRGPIDERVDATATSSNLLSFGLVLIELALSAPWRKLQLREDITENLFTWEKDLLNLMHLSETVTGELGSRYAKVVQTCVFQGLEVHEVHGLRKGELDKLIFEDIVQELDHCLSVVTFKCVPSSAASEHRK